MTQRALSSAVLRHGTREGSAELARQLQSKAVGRMQGSPADDRGLARAAGAAGAPRRRRRPRSPGAGAGGAAAAHWPPGVPADAAAAAGTAESVAVPCISGAACGTAAGDTTSGGRARSGAVGGGEGRAAGISRVLS